ncbi:C40 family peptidase [Streptomyces sp. UH6]|uniref:C40 family peptidase n=1 Tax=Streptomyces sp. UH6 TaxID=2748379 RepID=UPI0015D4FC77|nr:C40 family peptidase [Streptomyces sp. UH6]NYV73569.1 C40 family peptidase [Streptomyces sp. UH6]
MASHRKPRPTGLLAGIRTPALATVALTSVALLTQTAQAAPADRPSLEEVQKKVDTLYREAEAATEKYNSAKEQSEQQREELDKLLDDVAERTEELNEARERLGSYAAAQYRSGTALPDTATFLLADAPQDYFDQAQLMDRLTGRQKDAVDDFVERQAATSEKRQEATESLETLSSSEEELRTSKATVQKKLTDARELLADLTAEEKARLAEIERQKEEEARRKAEELARRQAAEEKARQEAAAEQEADEAAGGGSGADGGSGTGGGTDASATQGQKAVAFAEAQIGLPYVWGATGPDSYDCSGLTQAAWKAAGVDLPRTTYDQVNAGTTVPVSEAKPGDLVFFYDDVTHVGVYIGEGMMIHAPKPGAYVREESIYYDGEGSIHSIVRPA